MQNWDVDEKTLAEFLTRHSDLIESTSVYKQYIPHIKSISETYKLDLLKDVLAASLLKFIPFLTFDEIRLMLDNDKVETVVMAVYGKKFLQLH